MEKSVILTKIDNRFVSYLMQGDPDYKNYKTRQVLGQVQRDGYKILDQVKLTETDWLIRVTK